MLLMFVGGLVAAFNPCMLTMGLLAAGYIGGGSWQRKSLNFLASLLFVLAFAGTLALLGMGSGTLGKWLSFCMIADPGFWDCFA